MLRVKLHSRIFLIISEATASSMKIIDLTELCDRVRLDETWPGDFPSTGTNGNLVAEQDTRFGAGQALPWQASPDAFKEPVNGGRANLRELLINRQWQRVVVSLIYRL